MARELEVMPRVSFIVPTIGRPTLDRTLESIRVQARQGDEVLVCGPESVSVPTWCRHLVCKRSNQWGGPERRLGISTAKGDYLAFLDDDDAYLPRAREAMADAADKTPDRPVLFRMRFARDQRVIWQDLRTSPGWTGTNFRNGNMGSGMLFVPNIPERLGVWSDRYCGDFVFLNTSKWLKYEQYERHPQGVRPPFCPDKTGKCRCRSVKQATKAETPCPEWQRNLTFRPEVITVYRPVEAGHGDRERADGLS